MSRTLLLVTRKIDCLRYFWKYDEGSCEALCGDMKSQGLFDSSESFPKKLSNSTFLGEEGNQGIREKPLTSFPFETQLSSPDLYSRTS